jgi:hypothetical protein
LRLILVFLSYASAFEKPVLCRKLTRPTILAAFIFIAERDPAAVVAVEMWEPA